MVQRVKIEDMEIMGYNSIDSLGGIKIPINTVVLLVWGYVLHQVYYNDVKIILILLLL